MDNEEVIAVDVLTFILRKRYQELLYQLQDKPKFRAETLNRLSELHTIVREIEHSYQVEINYQD